MTNFRLPDIESGRSATAIEAIQSTLNIAVIQWLRLWQSLSPPLSLEARCFLAARSQWCIEQSMLVGKLQNR
jgi:hypothetical protein